MDDKYNNILINIEKLRDKYPNITNIWENYIKIKRDLFTKSMDDFEKIMKKLDNNMKRDLKKEEILLLYLISNTI